jgi:hypothetical protein
VTGSRNEGSTAEDTSIAAGWAGIGAAAGEPAVGTAAVGTNGIIYSAPRGNQYFSTLVKVGTVFKAIGFGALGVGTVADYYGAFQPGGSFGQANLNLGIGVAGLLSPVYAVPAGLYFIGSTYYPGGPPAYNAALSQTINSTEGGTP